MSQSNVIPLRRAAQRSGRVGRSGVRLEDVCLDYPIGPFMKSSLKASVFQLLGLAKSEGPKQQYVRALNGVSLRVEHGERLGIIGTNGSGKSTLLRAIAGIYPLQSGTIEIEGEIGALLDFTMGFEPEATGRENIYHRGIAMGLAPAQLRAHETDIVAFADLGDFIDLPVRTYSSGMYVRLGFAISTQFAPDLLLIDEVFGAGDAQFASRAIERMNDIVAQSGTLIMVAHDLGLVQTICDRAIWLAEGRVVVDGAPDVVVAMYKAAVHSG